MANLYSVLIWEGHDLGGNYQIELSPLYVWVVRDITFFFPGPQAFASMQVTAALVGCTIFSSAQATVPPAGISDHWDGRQVFVPPETGPTLSVEVTTPGGGGDVRISGYRLTPP